MMLGKVRRSQAKLGDAGDMPTSNQIEVKTKLVSPGDETIRIESGQSVRQPGRVPCRLMAYWTGWLYVM